MAGRTAFTLRVQTGCDQACSYCIIPTTRGRGRSVPTDDVVREARRVADSGFKEIALTGVHLGSYGRDLDAHSSLFELLCELQRADLGVTFRISSLEPMDCTPEIVDLVALSGGYFAPHFHLPLQHASDRMLAAMRRPYTLAYYRDLVNGIADRLLGRRLHRDYERLIVLGMGRHLQHGFETDVLARQNPRQAR